MNDKMEISTKKDESVSKIVLQQYATGKTIISVMDVIRNDYNNKINELNRKIVYNERIYKRKMWRKGR